MVFDFPVITWSLSGGHLTDQFGRYEPFLTFLEGHWPNCDPKRCQNPIQWTYYVTSDLWRSFGMVFKFPVITWSLSGGHLTDQFGRFEPFSTFLEGHRPNCDPKRCQNPMPWTYYVTSDLWRSFGMVFEFPVITWSLSGGGGHLTDQFGRFEPFSTFLEGHRPNCDPKKCQNPIPRTYHVT